MTSRILLPDEMNLHLVSHGAKPAAWVTSFDEEATADDLGTIGLLGRLGVVYERQPAEYINGLWCTGFMVGAGTQELRRLLQSSSPYDLGLALGYPNEAVSGFCERDEESFRYLASLGRAWQAGCDVPAWLAYISFIPVGLDLETGVVPLSARDVGQRYQECLWRHEPELARRIDNDFVGRYLPRIASLYIDEL